MDNAEILNQDQASKKSPFDDLSRDVLIQKCKGLLVIAQKAKSAKAELQSEFEKLESDKKANLEIIQTLQELVDSLTEQKLTFITEVDSAQSKIKLLTEKCSSSEEEIKKYKLDLYAKDKVIGDMTQKLSDIDCEIISLKRQNNRLLEENEQLINQLTDIEAKTTEFNNIGLLQQEQLRILEDNVQKDDNYKKKIDDLNIKIKELECQLQTEGEKKSDEYETKIQEITQLYESEKTKKDKVNIKLRIYKDKILKCAACINQLKNSRFILTKTVKEYSQNIPKWQNEIIKASKVLDNQIIQLNAENSNLKEKLKQIEKEASENTSTVCQQDQSYQSLLQTNEEKEVLNNKINDLQNKIEEFMNNNKNLTKELSELKLLYQELLETQLPEKISENELLKIKLHDNTKTMNDFTEKYSASIQLINSLKNENKILNDSLEQKHQNNDIIETLNFQIKALESEKSILVKEKLNAKENVIELEHQNRVLTDQVAEITSKVQNMTIKLDTIQKECILNEKKLNTEKEGQINELKYQLMTLQEQYDRLKKEYDDLQDLTGLLKEEVDTLKFSLEQPKDDSENLSDLNVSLQADIVKLETKLAAYKQENASLLIEVKELRNKNKELDIILADFEDSKLKLAGYKTENAELLNEMKELNQVLKERGESISKLQKAISEMERLIEALDKDRENFQQEKEDLLNKVESLENALTNIQEKTGQTSDLNKQVELETENALKQLGEKDAIIVALRDELEKIKQQSTASELANEDNMSTSTISKAEEHSRMKDLDETFEEKYTKLRIFALKLKKKLNETTNQLQNTENDKDKLEKLLSEQVDTKNTTTQSQDVVDSSNTEVLDLQNKIKKLNASLEATQENCVELQKLKAELTNVNQQLATEIEAHKVTKENLEKIKRDVKKKNVLSLEMEDYERSMKELTTKMEDNRKKMIQMESTIDTQEGTITAMKTQIKLLEEQIKTEETQNRLLKEELQHTIDERQEKDNFILMKNEIITKLEQSLEDEKRKNEESDLELTLLLSEKEKIIMSLGEDKVELNNKVKKLEFKCTELNDNLRILNIELADLKTEYTSYKVRAQAVLRQNQTVDHSQEEQLKEEAAALRTQIESLTTKLLTLQEQCQEQSCEVENARRRAVEATNEATRAQQRTARLHADLARLSQQLESERTQTKLQVSTLTQCYKKQISELEAKYKIEIDNLKVQLVASQNTTNIGKTTMAIGEASSSQYMSPIVSKDDSDGEMDFNVSMIPREEGEGSESAPSPPPSKPYMTSSDSGRSPVPLERLLEEGVPDDETLDTSSLALTPEQEIADLKRRLQTQQQRVKHITVLLSESERECARMAQLSELLKTELRRVRGSTNNIHNTEYMKNVTLKFLTLPPGDERSRLVPVLQKILTLTTEETQKIQSIAKGLDPNPSKGWGSYLPWPGGK